MPIGIQNITSVSMQNITDYMNTTGYEDFAIKVNHDIYGGWLYFIILWVLFFVLYLRLQKYRDQPFINIMYASTAISLISFFLRAIEVVQNGVVRGLLTDYQMWCFPIIAICVGVFMWASQER